MWADGASWRLGHWLNGRAGLSGLGEVVSDLCRRAGLDDADVSGLRDAVSGYVVDAPSRTRDGLAPLMAAYDFTAGEHDGAMAFFHVDSNEPTSLSVETFADSGGDAAFAWRGDAADALIEARVRFLDPARDYLIAGVSARRLDRAAAGSRALMRRWCSKLK